MVKESHKRVGRYPLDDAASPGVAVINKWCYGRDMMGQMFSPEAGRLRNLGGFKQSNSEGKHHSTQVEREKTEGRENRKNYRLWNSPLTGQQTEMPLRTV